MTFHALETSVDSGRPVELVEIGYAGRVWRMTTAETPQVRSGSTYIPTPMRRTNIEPSTDVAKSNLTISLPQDHQVGDVFRIQPPSEVVVVTIYARHVLDNEFNVIWKGRVINAEWAAPWLELTSDNIFTSLKRIGLRRRYSTQCTVVLYGPRCKASREAHKQVLTLNGISGRTLQSNAAIGLPADHFAGGYVTWTNSLFGNQESRMIRSSDGVAGTLTLVSAPTGLSAGMTMNAYPGCDHTLSDCDEKFDNTDNYGGTPFIPIKNPFGGTTMF